MTATKKCDGTMDGKPVKLIIIDKGWKQDFFAKPKDKDLDTPHVISVNGTLEVHQDSADGKSFRAMDVSQVGSGSLRIGSTFASNNGMALVILPMHTTANGFAINTNYAGNQITLPNDGEWCIMAFGKFGDWRDKPKPKGQVS
jgi:hypothetical protein